MSAGNSSWQCLYCGAEASFGHKYCSESCENHAAQEALLNNVGHPPVARVEIAPPSTAIKPAAGGGIKHDDGKLPLHLLPFDVLIEITKVLQFGAKKYTPNNWRGGFAYSRLFRAAFGHLLSWWMGQDLDEETGYSHLAHAGCCVMFLLHMVLVKSGTDDRKENNV